MSTGEVFLIRTTDGPTPGTRPVTEGAGWDWPLPAVLRVVGHPGEYRKAHESNLPPMPPDSRIKRSVEYVWHDPEPESSDELLARAVAGQPYTAVLTRVLELTERFQRSLGFVAPELYDEKWNEFRANIAAAFAAEDHDQAPGDPT